MNIKPLGDKLVLKQFEAEEKTKSGIILTSQSKEKPPIFEVIVAGDGVMTDGTKVEMKIKVGDKVVANRFSGMGVNIDEEEYIIISQSEVLALVD